MRNNIDVTMPVSVRRAVVFTFKYIFNFNRPSPPLRLPPFLGSCRNWHLDIVERVDERLGIDLSMWKKAAFNFVFSINPEIRGLEF